MRKVEGDFSYTISNWENPPADSSREYLASLLLSNLAKSRQWRNGKRHRALFLLWRNRAEIEAIAADNFVERVRAAGRTLDRFQYCAESLVLSNDKDDWEFEAHDEAGNFLLSFESISLIRDGLEQNGVEAPVFFDEFRLLEGKFRDWFGYFLSEKQVLGYIRESEPELEKCWWLTSTPNPAKIANRKYTADDFDRLMMLSSGEGFREDCPLSGKIIGFALKENSDPEVGKHFEKCPACQRLARDISEADQEASKMTNVSPMPPKLRAALKL